MSVEKTTLRLTRNIGKDESRYDEFKEGIPTPDAIAKYIMGFANASGGTIWIGIKDDGTITGVTATEPVSEWKDRFRLLVDAATGMLTPHYVEPILIDFEIISGSPRDIPSNGSPRQRSRSSPREIKSSLRFVIRICVNKSNSRYAFKNGLTYVRKEASTVVVDGTNFKTNLELLRKIQELETQLKILEKKIDHDKQLPSAKGWMDMVKDLVGYN